MDFKEVQLFQRICNQAEIGIQCDDHELMNPENYKKEMEQYIRDRETVLSALRRIELNLVRDVK